MRIKNYIKNLSKSMTYGATEIIGVSSPVLKGYIDSNKDITSATYDAVSNYRNTYNKISKAFEGSVVYEVAEVAGKSLLDTIRSGDFYSEERSSKYDKAIEESMGISFDDDDWGGSSQGSASGGGSKKKPAGDVLVSNTVTKAMMQSTEAIAETVAKSGIDIINNNRATTKVVLAQQANLFNNLQIGLGNIVGSIKGMHTASNALMGNIAENSRKYYEEMSRLINTQNAMMKEMLDIQRATATYHGIIGRDGRINDKPKKSTFSDLVGSNGEVSLKEYGKNIFGNIEDVLTEYSGGALSGIMKKNQDGGVDMKSTLLSMAANPLSFIPKMIASSLIGPQVQRVLKNFDKTLAGVFSTFISKMSYMAKNDEDGGIFGQIIGKIFGIKERNKTSLDTGKYEKGAVPWDGVARKALIDIIPGHLRAIEAALTGRDERIYDYMTDKWSSRMEEKEKWRNTENFARTRATSEVQDVIGKRINQTKFNNSKTKEMTVKELMSFVNKLYDDGGYFEPNSNKPGRASEYGISEESLRLFTEALTSSKEGRRSLMGLSREVRTNKDMVNKEREGLETKDSAMMSLFDGSFQPHIDKKTGKIINNAPGMTAILTDATDKFNNNIFHYLRQIEKEMQWQRMFLSSNGSKGGKGRGKGGSIPSIDDIKVEDNREFRTEDISRKQNERMDIEFEKDIEKTKKANSNPNKSKWFYVIVPEIDPNDPSSVVAHERALLYNLDITKAKEQEDLMKELQSEKDSTSIFGTLLHGDEVDKVKVEAGRDFMKDLFKADGMSNKYKLVKERLDDIINSPGSVIAGLIEKADDNIYSFFFGKESITKDGKTVNGFFDRMVYEMQSTFTNIGKWIETKVFNPLLDKLGEKSWSAVGKKYWNKFTGEGTLVRNSINATKDAFSNAGNFVKGAVKGVYNDVNNFISGNANGAQYVEKSGITAISKGEMIIPSELNPFNPNRNNVNKQSEISKENGIKNKASSYLAKSIYNSIGGYAKGVLPEELKAELSRINMDRMNMTDADGENLKALTPEEFMKAREEGKYGGTKKEPTLVDKMASNVVSGFRKTMSAIFGSEENNKQSIEDIKKKISDVFPKGVAGLIMGGVVGLATGFSPIMMAMGGSAISIASKSESFKNFMFGTMGEDGKRADNGFISKDIQATFNKYLPNVSKYGIAGGISSLILPFGPIGGMMIGSAIGFVKTNDTVKNFLFGDEDGILNKDRKDFIKKTFPNMATGAVATYLLGPFGILGSAVVGSVGGMVASSEKFKEFVFGIEGPDGKRTGGIFQVVRDRIINPLGDMAKEMKTSLLDYIKKDIISPLSRAFRPLIKDIGKSFKAVGGFGKWIIGSLGNALGIPLASKLDNILKKLNPVNIIKGTVNTIAKPLGKVISAPFKALGALGDMRRKSHIKSGDADYMTAEERLAFREQKGFSGDKMNDFDRQLSQMNSADVNSLYSKLKISKSDDKTLKKELEESRSSLGKLVSGTYGSKDMGLTKNIIKLAQSGKMDEAKKLLANDKNLTSKDKEKFISQLENESGRFNLITKGMSDRDSMKAEASKEFFNKFGVELSGNEDKFSSYLQSESNARNKLIGEDTGESATDPITSKLNEEIGLLETLNETAISILDAVNTNKRNGKKFKVIKTKTGNSQVVNENGESITDYPEKVSNDGSDTSKFTKDKYDSNEETEKKEGLQKTISGSLSSLSTNFSAWMKGLTKKKGDEDNWLMKIFKWFSGGPFGSLLSTGIKIAAATFAAYNLPEIFRFLKDLFKGKGEDGEGEVGKSNYLTGLGIRLAGWGSKRIAPIIDKAGNVANKVSNFTGLGKLSDKVLNTSANIADHYMTTGQFANPTTANAYAKINTQLSPTPEVPKPKVSIRNPFKFNSTKIVETTENVIESAMENRTKVAKIVDFIAECGYALIKKLGSKLPPVLVKQLETFIPKLVSGVSKKLINSSIGAGLKQIAAVLSDPTATALISIGMVWNGYEDYRTILSVTDEQPVSVRLAAGFINAMHFILSSLLAKFGIFIALIPIEFIVDIAMDYILVPNGFATNLGKSREDAKIQFEEVNKDRKERGLKPFASLEDMIKEETTHGGLGHKTTIGELVYIPTHLKRRYSDSDSNIDIRTKEILEADSLTDPRTDGEKLVADIKSDLLKDPIIKTNLNKKLEEIKQNNELADTRTKEEIEVEELKKSLGVVNPFHYAFDKIKSAFNVFTDSFSDRNKELNGMIEKDTVVGFDELFTVPAKIDNKKLSIFKILERIGWTSASLFNAVPIMIGSIINKGATVITGWAESFTLKYNEFKQTFVKVLSAPMDLVKEIIATTEGKVDILKNWLKDKAPWIYNWVFKPDEKPKPQDEKPKPQDEKPKPQDEKDDYIFNYGYGSRNRIKYGIGGPQEGKFYSQIDPKYSGINYNSKDDNYKQNMYDSGCGIMAASTVVNRMTGQELDPRMAAKYSIDQGYKERDGGTKPEFFNDVFNKYGFGGQISSDRNMIASQIKSGQPVVLMGQDANASGKNPFGVNPHYVVGTGIDRGGNMIVQDPESRTPDRKFSFNDVMSKTSLGVTPGSGMSKYRKVPRFGKGANKEGVANAIANGLMSTGVEGGYDSINPNDNGKGPSIGISQWNSERAAELLKKIPGGSEYARYMISSPLPSEVTSGLKAVLGSETGKKIQLEVLSTDCLDKYVPYIAGIPGLTNGKVMAYLGMWMPTSIDCVLKCAAECADINNLEIVHNKFKERYSTIGAVPDYGGRYNLTYNYCKTLPNELSNVKLDPSLAKQMGPSSSSGQKQYSGVFGFLDKANDKLTSQLSPLMSKLTGELGGITSGFDSMIKTSNFSSTKLNGASFVKLGSMQTSNATNNSRDWMLANLKGASITSGWGPRQIDSGSSFHKGYDFGANEGTPIPSPVAGTVTVTDYEETGYGNYAFIKDKDGITHEFGHMSQIGVKQGQNVKRGDIIGLVGDTGTSSGPHLHYTVSKDGTPNGRFDPGSYTLPATAAAGKTPMIEFNKRRSANLTKGFSQQGGIGDSGPGTKDYSTLLETVINILLAIASNTDKLNAVVSILGGNPNAMSKDANGNLTSAANNIQTGINNKDTTSVLSQVTKLLQGNSSFNKTIPGPIMSEDINTILTSMNAIVAK